MSCEDFPCCGHERGCCPDYVDGKQVNMKCVCGATVPLHNDVSLCETCLNAPPSEGFYRRHPDDVDDYDVDDEDVDACYMDQDDREDDDGPFERWDSENDA